MLGKCECKSIREAGLLWQTTNVDQNRGRKRQSMVVKLSEQSMAPDSMPKSAEKAEKRSRRSAARSFMPKLVKRVVSPPSASRAQNFTPGLVRRAVSVAAPQARIPLLLRRSKWSLE